MALSRANLSGHNEPRLRRSLWQLANTLIPYAMTLALMVWTAPRSFWITLALAIPAGGFLVRTFTLFHDCAHGSFFRSSLANRFWGSILGVLTFTPYREWSYRHAMHHAGAADLDRRGLGDIWTMTVEEYLSASAAKRLAYRFVRHPAVLFGLVPVYLFLVEHRFARVRAARRERVSVYWTNAALAAVVLVASASVGLETYILVQLPALSVAAIVGVWLFFIQHQFEGVRWERGVEWDFSTAALTGSSFYELPRFLQWFTGSIGFHHVHHMNPTIPNYNLEKCHREHSMFRNVKPLTLRASLRSLSYRLWDERRRTLVSFDRLREVQSETAAQRERSGSETD